MKAPIMTMIGSLSFASGCLIVAANSDRLATGREFVSQTKENTSAASIFLWQILACIEIYWPLIFLASASGFLIFLIAQKPLAARVLIAVPLLAVAYTTWRLPRPTESDLSRYIDLGNVECICTIESKNTKNSFICRSTSMLLPSKRDLTGKVLVTIRSDKRQHKIRSSDIDNYKIDQTIRVIGKLSKTYKNDSSWQRNPGHKLIAASVFSRLSTDSTQVKQLGQDRKATTVPNLFAKSWAQYWQNGRETITQSHVKNLGDERGKLLSSMVLGDRVVQLPKDLKALFRKVGLSHLLAASGFNLSIVVATSYFCARLLPLPGYCPSLAALLSTASFVCLAGPSPSVVRAALLCVLFLTARLFYRRVHALGALSLTLLIALLVDPLCIADVGLQLSYVATAGIISGLGWIKKRPDQGIWQRLNSWFKETVSVICLAQLSVLPLQLLYFKTAGLLFLPANLLVDPVVAPVTVIGFISSVITFACSHSPAGITYSTIITVPLDRLTSIALDYMVACTAQLARIDGTTMHFAPPVPGTIAIYYLCFIYFLYTLPNRHMRMLGFIAVLIGLCVLLFRPNIPTEITYLSKSSAMIIQNKHALLLTGDKCDWLGKQVLTFTGSDRISSFEGEEITTTYFDDEHPFEASQLDLHDFILVSLKPTAGKHSKRSKSSVRRKPLSWSQINRVAANLKRKARNKPMLLWTTGNATTLRQYHGDTNLYIASVNAWSPILISYRKSSSVPEKTPIKPTTEANSMTANSMTAKSITPQTPSLQTKSGELYPFKIRNRCEDFVVLQ